MSESRFWETKPLTELSHDEWESLCDGCARCCLVKLEDEERGDVYYTNVACALLDLTTCRCINYSERSRHVPECVVLSPEVLDQLHWMPSTCAYRLLWEGKPLPSWHPLISGSRDSVQAAGISVEGRVIAQCDVEEENLQDYIVHWPE